MKHVFTTVQPTDTPRLKMPSPRLRTSCSNKKPCIHIPDLGGFALANCRGDIWRKGGFEPHETTEIIDSRERKLLQVYVYRYLYLYLHLYLSPYTSTYLSISNYLYLCIFAVGAEHQGFEVHTPASCRHPTNPLHPTGLQPL